MTEPVHVARLVLLALATYLALAVGSKVIRAGMRKFLKSIRQRMLSYFTVRIRWVMFCLSHDRSLPENLSPWKKYRATRPRDGVSRGGAKGGWRAERPS